MLSTVPSLPKKTARDKLSNFAGAKSNVRHVAGAKEMGNDAGFFLRYRILIRVTIFFTPSKYQSRIDIDLLLSTFAFSRSEFLSIFFSLAVLGSFCALSFLG